MVSVTVALMIVAIPHVLEDFHYGNLLGAGIAPPAAAVLVALVLGLQVLGIALVLRGSSPLGDGVLALTGATWCIGALLVHGRELLFAGPDYRHGVISKLLEVLIIALGASAAWLGVRAVRARRTPN